MCWRCACPTRPPRADSLEHAQLVIERLGIASLTIPITEMVDPLFERFPEMSQVRRGNIMARARMIVLYDQSEAFNGLVVGTGNKTEILLGYTTLYGDSACALNPLGDLYKTQVRQLSRAMGVPPRSSTSRPPPTCGSARRTKASWVLPTQRWTSCSTCWSTSATARRNASRPGLRKILCSTVVERMRRNQFKRILPPIAKLTNRTVGYDFLYLRDWGT